MKLLEAIKGMSNAADLLAVVAAVRGRVKELPDEEQTKYYETDKAEDKQLGKDIKEDDGEGEGEETPGVDEGGNTETKEAPPEENKEPASTAAGEREKEIPNDEIPPKENAETANETPAQNTQPAKEDAMSILLEMRDMLKQNLALENQEQQEETPKNDEELEKPTPTDEEESYEDEDFFK